MKQPRLENYTDEDEWYLALCEYITELNEIKRQIAQKLKKASMEINDQKQT